jgi:multidrug resistance efflux pump
MNNQEAKEIVQKEEKLIAEVKKEEKLIQKLIKDARVIIIALVIIAAAAAGGIFFLVNAQNQIKIDDSSIAASEIDLAPTGGGALEAVYVNEGDTVPANTVVARVGNELVKSKISGTVIMARQDIGKLVAPGEKVVSMIDPGDLRVVGRLAEDKGLQNVSVGQRATFTVDAFSGRVFNGIVDEVSPTSRAGDVVFNISDQRQEQEFNVKVRYDVNAYPELKNGMSAKLTIYRN